METPEVQRDLRIADSGIQIFPDRKNSQIANGSELFNLEVSSGIRDSGLGRSRAAVFRHFGIQESGAIEGNSCHPNRRIFFPAQGRADGNDLDRFEPCPFATPLAKADFPGRCGRGANQRELASGFSPGSHGGIETGKGEVELESGRRPDLGGDESRGGKFFVERDGLQGNLSLSLETYGSVARENSACLFPRGIRSSLTPPELGRLLSAGRPRKMDSSPQFFPERSRRAVGIWI